MINIQIDPDRPLGGSIGFNEATLGDVLDGYLSLLNDARSGAAGYTPVLVVGIPGAIWASAEFAEPSAGKWQFVLHLDTIALGTAMAGTKPTIGGFVQVLIIETATGKSVTETKTPILIHKGVYAGALVPLPTYSDEILSRIEDIEAALAAGGVTPGETGAVSSVQGRTGAVVITKADLTLGNVDNTSDAAKPVSTMQAAAILAAENNAKNASRASNWVPTWGEITNKPLTFAPSAHGHAWTDLTGVPSLFDGTWGSLSGKPTSFTPVSHTHLWADLTDKPATFAPAAHSHAISDTTNLQAALDAKQATVARLTQLLALGAGFIKVNADGSLSVEIPSGAVGPDLTAIEALTGTGYPHRTGADTWVLDTPSGGGGGTKTYGSFTSKDFNPPATLYGIFDTRNSIPLNNFSDSALWSVFMLGIMPEAAVLTSGLKVYLHWAAITATTGNVRWRVEFERCNTDLDTDSFDTAVEATAACDATSGIEVVTEITITTIDGITAGDLYRLRVSRVGSDATNDTMSGYAQLVAVEIRGAA